jgi:hypothetical protein
MNGFARKRTGVLPDPATNETPSTHQDYLQQALGVPPVQQPESAPTKKKRPPMTDSGGQLYRGQMRGA